MTTARLSCPDSTTQYLTTDSTTDATAFIQAAIDRLPATGGQLILSPGIYPISSTLTVQDRQSLRISGTAGPSTRGSVTTDATVLKWNGAASGTVLFYDSSRDSVLESVQIESGTASLGVGIDIDRVSGTQQTPTNLQFKNVMVVVPTNGIGIRVANTYANNVDLMTFEDVTVTNPTGATNTTGYTFNSFNSHGHRFIRGSIANMAIGVNFIKGGAGNFLHTNFSFNTVSVKFQSVSKPVIFDSVNEESNASTYQFIDIANASSAQPITILNSRLSGGGNTLLTLPYIRQLTRGTLTLINNVFTGQGTANAAFGIRVDNATTGGMIYAVGNLFPNITPFIPPAGASNTSIVQFANTGYVGAVVTPIGSSIYAAGTSTDSLSLGLITSLSGTKTLGSNFRGTATFSAATTVAVTFGTAEPDTSYYISLGPTANKTFWVTSKTVNGFTLNASSSSSDAVDWLLIR